jgi:hypothetical protein
MVVLVIQPILHLADRAVADSGVQVFLSLAMAFPDKETLAL